MKKLLGIFGFLGAVLIIGLGFGYYKISPYLEDAKLRDFIQQKTSENYPNLNFKIADLSTSLGWNISVHLKDVLLTIKEPNPLKSNHLASIKIMDANIPWWGILTKAGNIQLDFSGVSADYHTYDQVNNWLIGLSTKEQKTKSDNQSSSSTEVSEIDSITKDWLNKITVSLDLKSVDLNILDKGVAKNKIHIESLGLDQISITKPFHLNLDSIIKAEGYRFQANLQGEVDLKEFLEKKIFETKLTAFLSQIFWQKKEIPDLKGKLNLNYSETSFILESDLDWASIGPLKFQIKQDQGSDLKIEGIDSRLKLKPLLNIFMEPSDAFSLVSEFPVVLKGALALSPSNQIKGKTSFSLAQKSEITLKDAGKLVITKLEGVQENDGVQVDLLAEQDKAKLNLKAIGKSLMATRPHYYLNIIANDLTLPSFENEDKGKKESSSSEKATASSKKSDSLELPESEIDLKLTNIYYEKTPINIKGKVFTHQSSVESSSMMIDLLGGKIVSPFKVNIEGNDYRGSFNTKLTNFNLDKFKPFLSEKVKNIQGVFEGSLEGSFKTQGEKKFYDVNYNLLGKDGLLQGVDLATKINAVIEKVNSIKKSLTPLNGSLLEEFKEIQIKGNLNQSLIRLDELTYLDKNASSLLIGKGSLGQIGSNQNSKLYLSFKEKDATRSAKLKKNLGSEELPLLLEGKEWSLKPDLGYTVEKIGKEVVQEKAKEEVKKVIDKNKDKIKEKAKDLLKGLFK